MSDLTGESVMPFGKHEGKQMTEVPDNYLLWYWRENKEAYKQGMMSNPWGSDVMGYIAESFSTKDLD